MKSYNKSMHLAPHFIRSIGDRLAVKGYGKGRFCIVNYHRVLESADPLLEAEPDVKTFRQQMELLAECFNVIPLNDALLALGTDRMPPRAICITFDDGYRSIHDLALPILRELRLPATIFVSTGYLDNRNMWNDRIVNVVKRICRNELDLRKYGMGIYPLSTLQERRHTVLSLTEASKYLTPNARAELIPRLESLVDDVGASGLMLNAEMIVNLAQAGIEIGAHTISHPILTSLDDHSASNEIVGCKRHLEAITGKPVHMFAYPNGKIGIDFDERHIRMVKEAGFTAAFTTEPGAVTATHDLFQIPRSRPWDRSPYLYAVRLLRWLGARDV